MRNLLHVHDYEMEFPSENAPLDWTLRCKCGDTASSLAEAMTKTRISQRERSLMMWAALMITAIGVVIVTSFLGGHFHA